MAGTGLRMWVAPPDVRGLREAVRHRCKLVALRSGLKAQVHAVLAKQGVRVPMSDLFGVAGTQLLDELALDAPFPGNATEIDRARTVRAADGALPAARRRVSTGLVRRTV